METLVARALLTTSGLGDEDAAQDAAVAEEGVGRVVEAEGHRLVEGVGDEQVIFDPLIAGDGEFIVNTFIPANTSSSRS